MPVLFEWITQPEAWMALVTLIALEVVPGARSGAGVELVDRATGWSKCSKH